MAPTAFAVKTLDAEAHEFPKVGVRSTVIVVAVCVNPSSLSSWRLKLPNPSSFPEAWVYGPGVKPLMELVPVTLATENEPLTFNATEPPSPMR